MIVPKFWAEERIQRRRNGKQITIKRFGWSDTSQDAAQANARQRAQDAIDRWLSGEEIQTRIELKAAYNGADGIPIREEIVSEHGDTIITRNSYGAQCLNSPDVFFADIDFDDNLFDHSVVAGCLTTIVVISSIFVTRPRGWNFVFQILLIPVIAVLVHLIGKLRLWMAGGHENMARQHIAKFIDTNPGWNLRIYRTPAGLRVAATHQKFLPDDDAVNKAFKLFKTDTLYVRMCQNQKCFRARVTAKPWRIGITSHMKPRCGVWPVAPDRIPIRDAWIREYEHAAKSFAACKFIESIGNGVVHPDVKQVIELHDFLSSALSERPIA